MERDLELFLISYNLFSMSAVDRVTSKNKDLTILCQVLCHFFLIIIKCVYILAEDHDMNESFLRGFFCVSNLMLTNYFS